MINENTTILVMTTLPDAHSAESLATSLVTQRLAACVNILGPCRSIYHWQHKLECSSEVPIMIKTQKKCYPALEKAILEIHPYELPEIIHIHIHGGLPAYLQWVETQLSVQGSAC